MAENAKTHIWDGLAARVDAQLERDPFQRDPDYIRANLSRLELIHRYFATEVRGWDNVAAAGPLLMVGNHSGGMYTPDSYALGVEWFRRFGVEREVYALAFNFVFSVPGFGEFLRRFGAIPASHANAGAALDRGAAVLVYPGGDYDAYRPAWQSSVIDFGGRQGFVRLALRTGVPVLPVVTHGSHESVFILTRGERLARAAGFNRLRIKIFPWAIGIPWGFAPGFLPTVPLPTKITISMLAPLDWSSFGPGAADDPSVVERCYDEITATMQAELTALAAESPHPLVTRFTNRRT